jgi:hypothetical protein
VPKKGITVSDSDPMFDRQFDAIQAKMIEVERSERREPARSRYDRDPQFRQLVALLYAMIDDSEFTPTELREAVILAAMRWEMSHTRPLLLRQKSD